jgi:hypothetical protein
MEHQYEGLRSISETACSVSGKTDYEKERTYSPPKILVGQKRN